MCERVYVYVYVCIRWIILKRLVIGAKLDMQTHADPLSSARNVNFLRGGGEAVLCSIEKQKERVCVKCQVVVGLLGHATHSILYARFSTMDMK